MENHKTKAPCLLRAQEAAQILNCSIATVWRRLADGTVPKPVKVGGMNRWPENEIREVIESAIARREG